MSAYTANNLMGGSQQNLTTTPGITVLRLNVPASSGKRFYIDEFNLSQGGTLNGTDCQVTWSLVQCSAAGAGTGTVVTPEPTQGGFVAAGNLDVAVTVATANYSAEPTTYTAAQSFFVRAVNQRSGVDWQASPSGRLYFPNTASTGPGFRAFSPTYASTALARVNFDEL